MEFSLAEYARAIVRARARIERHLDASMFGDPCFDMLLDLFAHAETGEPVYVTSVGIVARVPLTSALRYINLMEQRGWIERFADPRDGRRRLVRMTASTRATIAEYLEEVAGIMQARPGRSTPSV